MRAVAPLAATDAATPVQTEGQSGAGGGQGTLDFSRGLLCQGGREVVQQNLAQQHRSILESGGRTKRRGKGGLLQHRLEQVRTRQAGSRSRPGLLIYGNGLSPAWLSSF